MAGIHIEQGHAPISEVPTPVVTPEITLLPGETGSELTPEEKREKAEVENYRGMGGILSAASFRYAREVLAAYPNGDSSPLNREPLGMEVFSGIMLTDRQRYLYRALRRISRTGEQSPSDPRLFADVLFPLTGSGEKRRKIRARFEREKFSHVFAPSVRESLVRIPESR